MSEKMVCTICKKELTSPNIKMTKKNDSVARVNFLCDKCYETYVEKDKK